MKSKILGLLGAGLLAGSMTASAATMTYYVSGTFSDNGSLSGQIVFDATGALCKPDSANLLAAAGSAFSEAATYSGSEEYGCGSSQAGTVLLDFLDTVTVRFIRLSFDAGLPGSGPWTLTGYEFDNNTYARRDLAGSISLTPPSVPEPGTLALLGLGLAGLGLSRRRRAS